MEFGYAILKSDAANGAQDINISNCTVVLNNAYNLSKGIYAGNHTPASTSGLSIASIAGTNANIKINGCTVNNAHNPIYIKGYTTSTSYYDTGLEIGTTAGNTISGYAQTTTTAYGIHAEGQLSPSIKNNNITCYQAKGTTYGINLAAATGGDVNVVNNTISLNSSSTTSMLCGINHSGSYVSSVNITGNTLLNCAYTTATSASFYGIYEQGATTNSTVNISNNTIDGLNYASATTTGTGTVYGIYAVTGSPSSVTANSNTIKNMVMNGTSGGTFYGINLSKGNTQTANENTIADNNIIGTGSAGTFYGIRTATGTVVNNGNIIANNKVNKTSGTSTMYGIYNYLSPNNETYSGNLISGLVHAGTGDVYGIYTSTTTGTRTVAGNTVTDLTSNGPKVYGIYQGSSSPSIYGNHISNLVSMSALPLVRGIYINTGSTINIYNNMISELYAPAGTGTNAISGCYINGGTTVGLYFNTIYLDAGSGTTTGSFSTTGIYASSTPVLDMRNNIVVNKSIPVGTGAAIAYCRSTTNLATYSNNSNTNCFYAGTPSANNLIFFDGTNSDQTLAAYQERMITRDKESISENVAFVNTATAPFDLHINATVPTKLESSGTAVTSPAITQDYDAETRSTSPDIGADEGNFTLDAVNNDLAVTKIEIPAGNYFAGETVAISVTVKNSGLLEQTNKDILVKVDGATVGTYNLTAIAPKTMVTFSINWTSTAGAHAVTAEVPADDNAENNSLQTDLSINSPVTAYPYSEGFEDATFPPAGWSASAWSRVSKLVGGYAAQAAFQPSGTKILTTTRFVLPAQHQLKFDWKNHDNAKTVGNDTTFCEVSTDAGTTWSGLDTLSAPSSQSAYESIVLNLSDYATQTVIFRWRYNTHSTMAYGSNLDNISIEEIPGPSAINANNLPLVTALSQNYPNPFNPETTINFALANQGNVALTVYNAKGELVDELVNEVRNAGYHSVKFNAAAMNSGVYFYKLTTPERSMIQKMILVK